MMKTRRALRKISEPFAYVLIVAVFGFITTLANQTEADETSGDSDFVILNLQDDTETLNRIETFSDIEIFNEAEAMNRIETVFHKEPAEIDL
jgi:hypothetical protein